VILLVYCDEHRRLSELEWNLPAPNPVEIAAEKLREREAKARNAKKWAKIRQEEAKRKKPVPRKLPTWVVKTGVQAMRAVAKGPRKCSDCQKPAVDGKRRCEEHLIHRDRCHECPRPPALGKSRCERHLRAANARKRDDRIGRMPTRSEKKKRCRYMLSYREQKRLRGECYECKEKAVVGRGGRCEDHARRHDEIATFCASTRRDLSRGQGSQRRESQEDVE
jgi:hypothetical protein